MSSPAEDGNDRLFLVELKEGVLTIVPLGDVDSLRWHEVEQASQGVFELLGQEPGARVLVDMSKVRYCGSALLAVMVRVWKSVSPRGGILAFCNVGTELASVLSHTRLDTLWSIYPSREAAYAALRDHLVR